MACPVHCPNLHAVGGRSFPKAIMQFIHTVTVTDEPAANSTTLNIQYEITSVGVHRNNSMAITKITLLKRCIKVTSKVYYNKACKACKAPG